MPPRTVPWNAYPESKYLAFFSEFASFFQTQQSLILTYSSDGRDKFILFQFKQNWSFASIIQPKSHNSHFHFLSDVDSIIFGEDERNCGIFFTKFVEVCE